MSNDISLNNVKALFFDTADTLYFNEDMEAAYPQKLVELLVKTREISTAQAKVLLKETADKLKGTVKHVTKVRIMAELGFNRAQVHEALCTVNPREFLSVDQELNSVMARLSKKYKLGIISNFKRSHMIEIFSALGLSPEWFPILVTEDIVKEVKPDHEPFLKAIELSGYKANECMYVGDSPTKDMQPASEVGMVTVLVGNEIPKAQAEYIDVAIPDVKKIPGLLRVS